MIKIKWFSLFLLIFLSQGCSLFGDRIPEVSACKSWKASNTSMEWLQRKVTLSEIKLYLQNKNVQCASDILDTLEQESGPSSELWLFINPSNAPPAIQKGYALVRNSKIVLSFYKAW